MCEVPEGRKDEQSIYKKWNIQTRNRKMWDSHLQSTNPIGSMYAIYIYMVTLTINIPQMLAYILAPWILWEWIKYGERSPIRIS